MRITMPKHISSKTFYDEVIPNINYAIAKGDKRQIIIDFENTNKIEPVIVPALISLCDYIYKKTGYLPIISFAETREASSLKYYLSKIKFTEYVSEKCIFETNPYSFDINSVREMSPLNNTSRFMWYKLSDDKEARNKILKQIELLYKQQIDKEMKPFIYKYLEKYDLPECLKKEDGIDNTSNNIITNQIKEIAFNSIEHGESESFVTLQINYSDNKICIAVSDLGKGMLESKPDIVKRDDKEKSYNVLNRTPKNEMEAILVGIYKRKSSNIYGLYHIIKKVLSAEKAVVRIHSNDTQVILTNKVYSDFLDETLPMKLIGGKLPYNLRKSEFEGTHIEIEIPIKEGE